MSEPITYEPDSNADLRQRLAAAVERADRFHEALVEQMKRSTVLARERDEWKAAYEGLAGLDAIGSGRSGPDHRSPAAQSSD